MPELPKEAKLTEAAVPADFIRLGISRETAREFVRQVNALLLALSRSMEQFAFDDERDDENTVQETYLELQRIGFRFKSLSGRLRSRDQFDRAIENALTEVDEFLSSSRGYLFRNLRVRIPVYRIRASAIFLHPELHSSRVISAQEALYLLRESLHAAAREQPFYVVDDAPEARDIESIKKAIPAQKVAPAQFEVESGRLIVVDQNASPKQSKNDSITQSLESLLEQGSEIVDALRNGNFDKRVCAQFEKLQENLRSGQNIVKLGLENITSKAMAVAFSGELPDAVMAQIDGHATGIAMYVAQFEEWQIFVQNAAEAAIQDDAGRTLSGFVHDLLVEFEEHKDVVDPEVPKTIRFLSELIEDPKLASKRAVFAFIRTIENLISKSFGFVIEFVSKTLDKTSDRLSDAASSAIVRALVGIGIVSALGVLPITSGMSGMEWIEAAYRVVSEQIAPKLGLF